MKSVISSIVITIISTVFAMAQPVVSGSRVRDFLQGNTGKIVYTQFGDFKGNPGYVKHGHSLWFVSLDADSLVERKIIEDTTIEFRSTTVSPDGNWIALNTNGWVAGPDSGTYIQQGKVYVCSLAEAASQPIYIDDGAQPHWWQKPGTSDLYLLYTTLDHENGWQTQWPSCGKASTWCIRMIDHRPAGSPALLSTCYFNGGRSHSGAWAYAASRASGTFRIDPSATENAAIHDTIMFDSLTWGCNPSMSPDLSDTSVRVMHLDDSHETFTIQKLDGTMIMMKQIANDGNVAWDCPEWSNHENYSAAVASAGFCRPPFDIYIFRISDSTELKVIDGNFYWPYLWVQPDTGNSIHHHLPLKNDGRFSILQDGNVITINHKSFSSAAVAVFDVRGCEVRGYQLTKAELRIRLDDFPAGTYFFSITSASSANRYSKKIILEK